MSSISLASSSCSSSGSSSCNSSCNSSSSSGKLAEMINLFTKYLEDFKLLSSREDDGRRYIEFQYERYSNTLNGIPTKSALTDGSKYSTEISNDAELHLTSIILREFPGKNNNPTSTAIFEALMYLSDMSGHGVHEHFTGLKSRYEPCSKEHPCPPQVKKLEGSDSRSAELFAAQHSKYGVSSRHFIIRLIAVLILIKKVIKHRSGEKLDVIECLIVKILHRLGRGPRELRDYLKESRVIDILIKEAAKTPTVPVVEPLPLPTFDLPSEFPSKLKDTLIKLAKYRPEIAAFIYIIANLFHRT
jgi:hypothetical protein